MAPASLLRIVSQQSLMSCRLELEDRRLERASLFPLFDDEGQTRVMMITAEEDSRILLADWTPGVFVREWWWRNRVRLRFSDLNDASMWDEARLEGLWHFDPWWVLGDERFQGHGSVPALRRTNIPGYDTKMAGLTFSPDLGRAEYVVRASGQSKRPARFTPDTLAAAGQRRRAMPVRSRRNVAVGWRLRPFWRALGNHLPHQLLNH
jgi:hypothetical protein